MAKLTAPRNLIFISYVVLSVILFWTPLSALLRFSWHNEEYSHIILIPFISVSLAIYERKKIFSIVSYGYGLGTALLLMGVAIYGFAGQYFVSPSVDKLTPAIVSIVVVWAAGFAFCFGARALRAAAFSLLFLFLMVPIPASIMDQPILFVQRASAEVAEFLFNVTGVPVLRNEFVFSLPGLTIEIVKHCSGIHSTLSLFLVSLIAGHLGLRSKWRRAVLALAVFPIVSMTNGLRIFAISVLSAYVSPSFLTGDLHRDGGMFFFLLALLLLAPLWSLFSKTEARNVSDSLQIGSKKFKSESTASAVGSDI